MGRGTPKDTAPGAATGAARKAESVIQALSEGKAVSPDAIAAVKQQLLAELQSSSRSKQAEAGNKLGVLYRNTEDRQDRWELAGDLLVAGTAGAPVLEGINDQEPIAFLKRMTQLPVGKQLEAVVKFLEIARLPVGMQLEAISSVLAGLFAPSGFPAPGRSEEPPSGRHPDLARRPVDGRKEADPQEYDPLGDGPTDLDTIIRDNTQPVEARLNAAEQMGSLAVSPLTDLVRAPQSDTDLEFATQGLLRLSQTGAYAAIQRQLEVLVETGHRDIADHIQEAIRAMSSHAASHVKTQREPEHTSVIPDNWLRSAIARGDGAGILQAGLGREALAIRLILRRCAAIQRD